MKFQPARHDLAPCPSEVESISAHARLATHASASAPEVLLTVAAMHSLRAVHVALSHPELIKALIDQGFSALRARRTACACVGWKAGRKTRPASSIDANFVPSARYALPDRQAPGRFGQDRPHRRTDRLAVRG
ncbi:hypothetical protein [Bradyrhizobium uaiense]|uniref:Uncharacterized protein n=1 Tax=Bradyrhizobium uaiense TaxID=2594946 RepID=A0A6P1BHZ2_9BRAD|nr:hypothetical protein [Bradyrhizobium uaiense]NEU98087.1 hypothetical protein [Bradyrhizobium uaiense]